MTVRLGSARRGVLNGEFDQALEDLWAAHALAQEGIDVAALAEIKNLAERIRDEGSDLQSIDAAALLAGLEQGMPEDGLQEDGDLEAAVFVESAEDDEEAEAALAPFPTDNPWLEKIFTLPSYGNVPLKAVDLLREVSPDRDEQIVAALRVRHGNMRRGYLIATTKWLRYIQTLPTRNQDYWGYDFRIEVRGGFGQGGVIVMASGDLFQTRWGKAKQFKELYAAMQQAVAWEAENAPERTVAPPQVPSLSDELERLAALHARGVLTNDEFQNAKRRVLSAS